MGDVQELLALEWLWRTTGATTLRCGARTVTLPIQSINNALIDVHTIDAHDLDEHNAAYLERAVLCGLALDIVDSQGQVVWTADNTVVQDLPGAHQALKDLGLDFARQVVILDAIRRLRPPAAVLQRYPEAPGMRVVDYEPWAPHAPQMFAGCIEESVRYSWHYTTADALHTILTSGAILPSKSNPHAILEKPLVWCSIHPIYETASLHALGFVAPTADGLVATASFEGMQSLHTALVRIGLPPAQTPLGFAAAMTRAEWPPRLRRHVRQACAALGAQPQRDHRASLQALPAEAFQVVDLWDDHDHLWRRLWTA